MWWRVPRGGALWDQTKGAKARRDFKRLVQSGKAHGVLAFEGDVAVGWCAFGPRVDFPRTERTKAYARPSLDGVYSINCFFIRKGHRGQGVASALLEAATQACRSHGAKVIEAYPVPDDKPMPAAFAWRGPLSMFEKRGFKVVQRLSPARPVVELER